MQQAYYSKSYLWTCTITLVSNWSSASFFPEDLSVCVGMSYDYMSHKSLIYKIHFQI